MTRISHVGTISNMNIHINPLPRVYKRDTAYVISKKKNGFMLAILFSANQLFLLKPAIPNCPSCKEKKKKV